jgi:nucleoside-diphosphate-sugar epimerase
MASASPRSEVDAKNSDSPISADASWLLAHDGTGTSKGILGMRVLVLGGTGSIGSAVVDELLRSGHEVLGLARSERAAAVLRGSGAAPLIGDIRQPESWVGKIPPVDAVVHAATDFSHDMADVDDRLLDVLLPMLGTMPCRARFIYTGGCWLYGETRGKVAKETTPFNPLPAFAWSVPMLERDLRTAEIEPLIIHPAMVYTHDGGVLSSFIEDARRADNQHCRP